MHQIAKAISLQHGHPHSPTTVSQYLPYLRPQDSYAAAVRRTRAPVHQLTSISHSRNSSPLSHSLMRNLSNLHLNSKGSSASSTASDTPSERERPAGRGRGASHSAPSRSSSDGRRSGTSSPGPPRHSGRPSRTPLPAAPPGSQHRRSPRAPPQARPIPGMPPQADSEPRRAEGESRPSEGGWIKVQHARKPHRQAAGKPGKERARGSWRGRRMF